MAKVLSDVYGRWPYTWEEREKVLELEFPLAEYQKRIDRMRRHMVEHGFTAMLIYGGKSSKANVRYLSGWESFFGDTFLIVPADRDPILITNSTLHGEPMHSNIQVTWVRDFRPAMGFGTVLKMQSPVDYVVEAFRELNLLGKRVGYADQRSVTAYVDRELREKIHGTEVVDGMPILAALRKIKSPAEIEVIRQLATAVSLGMEEALKAAVPGNTEHDVAAAFYFTAIKNGCDTSPMGMRIQSGVRSSMKNVLPLRGKIIRDGEIVSIDTSADLYGYQSDHARSTVAGKSSADQIRLLEACVEAQEAGLRATGPGKRISDVIVAMEQVSRDYGFAEWDWSCGHGFGLDLVEQPFIVRESEAVFEAGQTFFIEPMIVPTHMGTSCFEDSILVTEQGAERLTTSTMRPW